VRVRDSNRMRQFLGATVVPSVVLVLTAGMALAGMGVAVSQRGRMFDPGEVTLRAGEALKIVNNDGDLLHHAYVEAPGFKFDSGEQEPGQSVSIRFPEAGAYEVLCGIHPKMRLKVTVK
jgi:plastocyanin